MSFFSANHFTVDKQISELETKLEFIRPTFGWTQKYQWDEVFKITDNLKKDFKTVRYPTREERDQAWNKFFQLRDFAYKERNRQYEERSNDHLKPILTLLNQAHYNSIGDFIVGKILSLGLLKASKEEMIQNGKTLGKAISLLNSVRHEMTLSDKNQAQEQIDRIKESHNDFWHTYNSAKNYALKDIEDKKEARVERIKLNIRKNTIGLQRAEDALEKIEANILLNKTKIEKAENALKIVQSKREDLKDKIDESYSDNWIEKAEGWLDDYDNTINEIEESIDKFKEWVDDGYNKISDIGETIGRYKQWIQEDEGKL